MSKMNWAGVQTTLLLFHFYCQEHTLHRLTHTYSGATAFSPLASDSVQFDAAKNWRCLSIPQLSLGT